MQLIDPTWSFIDATSSMVFIFNWSFWYRWHDFPNRINFGSPLFLRGLILPNVRCPVSSYIMQQNPFYVNRVLEIWGAELFPHLIVLNKELLVLRDQQLRANLARTLQKHSTRHERRCNNYNLLSVLDTISILAFFSSQNSLENFFNTLGNAWNKKNLMLFSVS